MIARESLAAGDVVNWYVWTGTATGSTGNVDSTGLVYGRVVRANRTTVTVDTEHGLRRRIRYAELSSKVAPTAWSPWNREGN